MKVLHMHGDFFLRGAKVAAKGAGELLWQDNIVILNRLTKIRVSDHFFSENLTSEHRLAGIAAVA